MEQLTIKELAPYLPYNIKVLNGWGDIKKLNYTHLDDDGNGVIFGVKPILRPLSDLTKEIEVNGEKFVPIMVLFGGKDYNKYPYKIDIVDKPILGKYINIIVEDVGDITFQLSRILNNRLNYEDWQYLHSLHFDTFGLIDKGLAIDINTI